MKLVYRGVEYNDVNPNSTSVAIKNQEVIYRGNSSKAKINPKFPWLKYIKQLLYKSQSKPVLDPITFWYNHRREFLENCWYSDIVKKLERSWSLTLQIERTKTVASKLKTQLKYRSVTYYR